MKRNMEPLMKCTAKAFRYINGFVIVTLLVLLFYVSNMDPTLLRVLPRSHSGIVSRVQIGGAIAQMSLNNTTVNDTDSSSHEESIAFQNLTTLSLPLNTTKGNTTSLVVNNTTTEESIKLTNWITKDYILSQLDEYKPPKFDSNRSLVDQMKKYNPANFASNLNVQPAAPGSFISNMKNPCWRIKTTLHCLPYYYLLGFPKSGTTDLWHRITQHPQQAGSGKELQWWSRHRYKRPLDTFTRYFSNELSKKTASYKAKHKNQTVDSVIRSFITGDGSPSYLWDVSYNLRNVQPAKNSANKPVNEPDLSVSHLIKAYTPQSKFIAIMRDPVDVMYSHYLYQDSGRFKSPTNFHHRVTQILAMYDDCFKRHSIRACVYDPNHIAEGDRQGVRLYHIFYVVFLSDWFKIIPRKQFLAIRNEDYEKDVDGYMRKVFKFLDVAIPEKDVMTKITGFKHANVQKKVPSWKDTQKMLEAFVQPFNDALADLLQDKGYSWKRT